METPRVSSRLWLAVSLACLLISGFGAHWVQTAGGAVVIRDMRWETPSGHMLSALLFKPKGASRTSPRPAVVASHGMLNSREMQDSVYVELARRGYVVVAIDMYGHGFSEMVSGPERDASRGTGLYDAVELVSRLPYIDKARIGITGHSFGGRSSNWSVELDNKAERPLVSAVLLQAADGIYADPKTRNWVNIYGARPAAIIADAYDEFFFRQKRADGSTSKPADFLTTDNAQSFLHFGAAPSGLQDRREAGRVYTETVDGKPTTRAIWMLPMTHPWVPFSAAATGHVVSFFQQAFGAPTPLPPSDQVWHYKEAFNALGLVGFALFLVQATLWLLETARFAPLHRPAEPALPVEDTAARRWLWGGLVASAVVSALSYLVLFDPVQNLQPGFRTQYPPLFIGIWAAVNGLFGIALILAYRASAARGLGFNLRRAGATMSPRRFGLTLLLALVATAAAYAVVFATDYLFKADFRLWVLAIKPFGRDHLWPAIAMFPFFALYFVVSSVATNAFQRFTFAGAEWLNLLVVAGFAALGGLVILVLQYATFFLTGEMNPWIQAMQGIYMLPTVVILFVAPIIARRLYLATSNPYLGGLINAMVVTLMSIANTQTLSSFATIQ